MIIKIRSSTRSSLAELAACLATAPEAVQHITAPELSALQALAQRRDSLRAAGALQPAQELAARHQARLQALLKQYCAPE